MKPLIFETTNVGTGTLCIMPKPDGRYLPEAVAHFRLLGIDSVVSLLEADEIAKFGLSKEGELCAANHITFLHFPIANSQCPTDAAAFRQLVTTLYQQLQDGKRIAIHCRAGIGRTGVLAACILKQAGYDTASAVQLLSHARGFPVPETDAQYAFIQAF